MQWPAAGSGNEVPAAPQVSVSVRTFVLVKQVNSGLPQAAATRYLQFLRSVCVRTFLLVKQVNSGLPQAAATRYLQILRCHYVHVLCDSKASKRRTLAQPGRGQIQISCAFLDFNERLMAWHGKTKSSPGSPPVRVVSSRLGSL